VAVTPKLGSSLTGREAGGVELRTTMLRNQPPGLRVVHLFPAGAAWRVLSEDGGAALDFPTLGHALDAATCGPELTRVVVHGAEPARRAG
jgi:hypothetical protein